MRQAVPFAAWFLCEGVAAWEPPELPLPELTEEEEPEELPVDPEAGAGEASDVPSLPVLEEPELGAAAAAELVVEADAAEELEDEAADEEPVEATDAVSRELPPPKSRSMHW